MNILIISPHGDDEVLGCGGTIAKLSPENNVTLCTITKPIEKYRSKEYIKNRKKEIIDSSKILGIKNIIQLNFPNSCIDMIPFADLCKTLMTIVRDSSPDIVFIPFHGDLHQDHSIICKASLVAMRPITSKVKKIYCYEVPSETEFSNIPFTPNTYIDISSTLCKKQEAIGIYKSELRKYPHPRCQESLEYLSKKRGMESGLLNAEAFILIREII